MTKTPPPATEVRRARVEFRKQDNRTMTGLVATYGRVYDIGYMTERLLPGCFAKSITEAARALPLSYVDHNSALQGAVPVGRAIAWEDTEETLVGTWEFDTRADAVEAARLADEGFLSGLSVGFNPLQSRWAYADGPGAKDHVDRIECRLLETSLCAVPAYEDAAVLAVRSSGNPERGTGLIVPRPGVEAARAWLEAVRSV